MKQAEFLHKLQTEAALQSKLYQERWLPAQLDPLATLVGRYSWQTLVVLAVVTSAALQIIATK